MGDLTTALRARPARCTLLLACAAIACRSPTPSDFPGTRAGEERTVAGVALCWCPPGKFTMGSPPGEPERRPGETQVGVTISRGFWMAKYETTQGDWKRAVGALPGPLTTELPAGDDYPVGNVNFAEAEGFCARLTELAHGAGELPADWEFRLPTEAQWEYACRAGTTSATSFGERLSSTQANFRGKPYNGAEPGPSLGRAARVGSYPANAWGLCDMHGNIYEWCRDWYHAHMPGGIDPDLHDAKATATPSEHGDYSRVRRGGCWADDGWALRTAFRLRFEPERRYDHIGFRVVAVRVVPEPGHPLPAHPLTTKSWHDSPGWYAYDPASSFMYFRIPWEEIQTLRPGMRAAEVELIVGHFQFGVSDNAVVFSTYPEDNYEYEVALKFDPYRRILEDVSFLRAQVQWGPIPGRR